MRRLLLVLALVLAGCADSPSVEPADNGTESESMTTSTPPVGGDGDGLTRQPIPARLELTDCEGLRSGFILPAGMVTAGDEVPRGWEASDPTETEYEVFLVQCGRLSVGPFERGPLFFLVEFHDQMSPPEACANWQDAPLEPGALRSIWFDDPEIVSYLSSTLGMPAMLGVFDREDIDVPSGSQRTWTWSVPDGPESEFVFARLDTPVGGNPDAKRLFWHNGSAVSLLDLVFDDHQPLVTPPVVAAIFEEPMMLAGSSLEASPGVFALVDPGGDFSGPIQRFGDLQCGVPLP